MTPLDTKAVLEAAFLLSYIIRSPEGAEVNWAKTFRREAGCSLNFQRDFPEKEPVLLKSSNLETELIEPFNNSVTLAPEETIILACPGPRNKLSAVGEQSAPAKCVRSQTLSVDGYNYEFNQLQCTKLVTGQFLETNCKCGYYRGVIKHIGYLVDGAWYTLFDVCYDNKNGNALYADHVIYGSALSNAKYAKSRPGFKVGGLAHGVPAAIAYKQVTEKATFNSLLGSATLAEKYIHRNSYLARGHLAPHGDFVFVSSQFSTYFYINTVPQWQAINNGNWKSLEFAIRGAAVELKSNFRVITGGHEVLSYPNSRGRNTQMYLVSSKKLPIPKFVWKVIYAFDTGKAIAFVNLNDPFKNRITASDYLCKDICKKYNWGSMAWNNTARGLLYCCEFNELAEVVPTLPPLDVTGIQSGKGSFDHLIRF